MHSRTPDLRELCTACPLRRIGPDGLPHVDLEPGSLAVVHLPRGQVVPMDQLRDRFMMVRQGSVKVEFLERDGTPEIAAFLLRGNAVVTAFTDRPAVITALEETRLCDLDPGRISCGPEASGHVLQEVSHAIGAQAAEDQRRLIQARTGAVSERLLWFLQDMGARQSSATVRLAMGRSDIAHYLQTTAESVSRGFTELADSGAIVLERPRIVCLKQRRQTSTGAQRA